MQNKRLPLSPELICQDYLLNVYALSSFLNLAIHAIQSTGHTVGDMERYGFDLCMGLLTNNTSSAIQAGEALQEMEGGNG